MPIEPGTVIAGYSVQKKLGAGAMGAVYLAEHAFTKRRVALKLMHAALSNDRDLTERIVQEARSLAELSHPNVVTLYDANVTDDGHIWLATEYLDGKTLHAVMALAPVPLGEALRYLIDIADGVAAAHELSIIHRDLKPENVFVTRQGAVKVLDFGAAKARGRSTVKNTTEAALAAGAPRRVIGTPAYMSPEHLRGASVDERTDIYALGMLGYEIFFRHPFLNEDGTHPSSVEMGARQIAMAPTDLSVVAPHLPPALCRAIMRAIHKHPSARQQRMHEFSAELRVVARALKGAVLPLADVVPFAPTYSGPGSYAAHGPAFALPAAETQALPSRRVVADANDKPQNAANVGNASNATLDMRPRAALTNPETGAATRRDASGEATDVRAERHEQAKQSRALFWGAPLAVVLAAVAFTFFFLRGRAPAVADPPPDADVAIAPQVTTARGASSAPPGLAPETPSGPSASASAPASAAPPAAPLAPLAPPPARPATIAPKPKAPPPPKPVIVKLPYGDKTTQ